MAGPPSPEEKSPASLQGPGSDSSHHLGAVQTAEIRPEKAHLGNPELDALLSGTFSGAPRPRQADQPAHPTGEGLPTPTAAAPAARSHPAVRGGGGRCRGRGGRKNAERPLESCRGQLGTVPFYHVLIGRYLTRFPDILYPTVVPPRFIYRSPKTGVAKCNCQEDIITRICF